MGGAEEVVGFVDEDQGAPGGEALVADAEAGEAGSGGDVALGVALADFDESEGEFAGEGFGEGGLAGSGGAVEEDVGGVVGLGGKEGFEEGGVVGGESAVEGEGEGVVGGGAFEEAVFEEAVAAAFEEVAEGAARQVEIVVEEFAAAEGSVWGQGPGHGAEGPIRGHGVKGDPVGEVAGVEGIVAEGGEGADDGVFEEVAGDAVQGQEGGDFLKAGGHRVGEGIGGGAGGEEGVAGVVEEGAAGGTEVFFAPDGAQDVGEFVGGLEGAGAGAAAAGGGPDGADRGGGFGGECVEEFGGDVGARGGGPFEYAHFLQGGEVEMAGQEVDDGRVAEGVAVAEQVEEIAVGGGAVPVVHEIAEAADFAVEKPAVADVVEVAAAGGVVGHGVSLGWEGRRRGNGAFLSHTRRRGKNLTRGGNLFGERGHGVPESGGRGERTIFLPTGVRLRGAAASIRVERERMSP